MPSNRAKWLVVALAFLLPLAFAAFTQHAWEDYFITLRASRNLVEGHGLVFNPGQRLHTFTSPLGVLLPALCTWIAGVEHEEAALWLFRVINAALLAAMVLLVWRRAVSLRLGSIGLVTLFGLLLADAKLTDFSINGMETAILVYFLMVLWSELEAPAGPRVIWLAVAYAGLMWTRPDAFFLAGLVTFAFLVFPPPAVVPAPRRPWRQLVQGILLGILLYAPWVAWAWWYYGTPVPHTITAKAVATPSLDLSRLLVVHWQALTGANTVSELFLPAYSSFGSWPKGLWHLAHGMTLVAMFAWLVPAVPGPARRASLAVCLGALYFQSIILFPWYIPPWTVLAIIALAFLLDAAAKSVRFPALRSFARIACLAVVVVQAGVWLAVSWQMRVHQRYVETGVRRAIGVWLHEHAAPGDAVLLEPLGYIGYFSQLKTYDIPGLSSPEVVTVMRSGDIDYSSIIARLKPRWLVMRPFEIYHMGASPRHVLDHYDAIQEWSARPQLDATAFLPGRRWSEWESSYVVFRRKPEAPPPTPPKPL